MTQWRSLLHSIRDISCEPRLRSSTPRVVGHSAFGAGDGRLLHDLNCGDSQSSRRALCHVTRKASFSHQALVQAIRAIRAIRAVQGRFISGSKMRSGFPWRSVECEMERKTLLGMCLLCLPYQHPSPSLCNSTRDLPGKLASAQTSSRRTGKTALRRSRGAAFDRRRSATVSITGSRITIQIANSDMPKLLSPAPTSRLISSSRAEHHPSRTRWRPHQRTPIWFRCPRLGHRRPIPRPLGRPLRLPPREQTGR
jgi:hypothetical protein